jgi:hypothetical protein
MKKTLLALAVAVLLLAIVMLKNRSNDNSLRADAFVFDTTKKNDISSLWVTDKKDTATLEKSGGKWITARDSFPVDTAKVNKNLSYVLSLQDKEVVSRSAARLAEYGLDTPQAKHLVWHGPGDKVSKVVIGKTSGADYSSTYWKWEESPEVYRTPGNFSWEITAKNSDWKDRGLFKAEAKDIRSVQVDWRDTADVLFHYKLEVVNDTTVKMVEPESMLVKKNLAQDILGRFSQLSIDDFVAANDTGVSKARLDTPMVDLKFSLKDGKSYELKAGRNVSGILYVQHPFRKDIVKLAIWRFDPFRKKPFELDTKFIAPPPADPDAHAPRHLIKPMVKMKR